MIIAKVTSKADGRWAVIVSNGLLTEHKDLSSQLHMERMPKSGHVPVPSALAVIVMIVCIGLY